MADCTKQMVVLYFFYSLYYHRSQLPRPAVVRTRKHPCPVRIRTSTGRLPARNSVRRRGIAVSLLLKQPNARISRTVAAARIHSIVLARIIRIGTGNCRTAVAENTQITYSGELFHIRIPPMLLHTDGHSVATSVRDTYIHGSHCGIPYVIRRSYGHIHRRVPSY